MPTHNPGMHYVRCAKYCFMPWFGPPGPGSEVAATTMPPGTCRSCRPRGHLRAGYQLLVRRARSWRGRRICPGGPDSISDCGCQCESRRRRAWLNIDGHAGAGYERCRARCGQGKAHHMRLRNSFNRLVRVDALQCAVVDSENPATRLSNLDFATQCLGSPHAA